MTDEVSRLRFDKDLEDQLGWSRRVFDSLSSGITIADARAPDMPLIYANPAFERMTGYHLEEICGRNCRFLQGLEREQAGLTTLRDALRDGHEVRTVLRNYRKDGTTFWNELFLSPIHDQARTLTHFVAIQNDVSERVELEAKLSHMAHYDMLTGLANRALLMERMEQALTRAGRTQRVVAVLFFDLDNFKEVNDVFGHAAGDGLLKVVAARLRATTRRYESVARLGGDEFVVVLEELNHTRNAQEILERLLANLQKPMVIAGREFTPSASVGMAWFPQDGRTPVDLLRAADVAMYTAKNLRRQRDTPKL